MRRPSGDRGHDRWVVAHLQAQKLSRYFPCDIVGRWPEATGNENDFGMFQRVAKRSANRGPVRHRDLPLDAQPERKDLSRDEREMGIEDVAEEKFRAGIKDDCLHRASSVIAV
jgi:hypothetical protein